MTTHVLRESISPAGSGIWTMWCGANCVAFPDATLVPELDFYTENHADKASCKNCKHNHSNGIVVDVPTKMALEPA